MIVTCPDCATRYDVDEKAFAAGGRAVRCHHCGCEWYQIGPATASPRAARSAASDAAADSGFSVIDPSDTLEGEDVAAGEVFEATDDLRESRRGTEVPAPTRREVDAPRGGAAARIDRVSDAASEPVAVGPIRRGGPSGLPTVARRDADAAAARMPAVVDEAEQGRRARRAGTDETRAARPKGRRVFLGAMAVAAVAAGAVVGVYSFGPEIKAFAPETANVVDYVTNTVDGARERITPEPAPSPVAAAASAAAPADIQGVVFVEYSYDLVEQAEGPALLIFGRIANNGPEAAIAPPIEIVTLDGRGNELQRWLAFPEENRLAPGESSAFQSRMMFPTQPVEDVEFSLTNP